MRGQLVAYDLDGWGGQIRRNFYVDLLRAPAARDHTVSMDLAQQSRFSGRDRILLFSNSVAVLWFVYLLFVGNMTVHQFSPSKTIGIMLLTLVAMGFMAFISLLFFSLVQQIVAFISVIYQELVMRT